MSDAPTRLAAVIEYHGASFAGSQTQPKLPTVQGCLENALGIVARLPVKAYPCGRTDSGVHATGWVAHFDWPETPSAKLPFQLTALLPKAMSVREIRRVPADFHARFRAFSRTYEYSLHQGRRPLLSDRSWSLPRLPDLDALREHASLLLGRHDFSALARESAREVNPICTLASVEWLVPEPGCYLLRVEGDRFLHNMIRAMVGTMVYLAVQSDASGRWTAILASRDRSQAGRTAPACGLCLVHVGYPDWDDYEILS